MRAIISRGLYIYYPIFEDHFFVFKVFSEKIVLLYGLRAYSKLFTVMGRKFNFSAQNTQNSIWHIFSELHRTFLQKASFINIKCIVWIAIRNFYEYVELT